MFRAPFCLCTFHFCAFYSCNAQSALPFKEFKYVFFGSYNILHRSLRDWRTPWEMIKCIIYGYTYCWYVYGNCGLDFTYIYIFEYFRLNLVVHYYHSNRYWFLQINYKKPEIYKLQMYSWHFALNSRLGWLLRYHICILFLRNKTTQCIYYYNRSH